MNYFNLDIRKIFILGLLVALPVISVNLQKSSNNEPWILQPFYFLASWTQNSLSSLTQGVRSTTDLYLNLLNIKKENRELKEELSLLKTKLSAMTELNLENERLNQLLDFKKTSKMNLVATRIIGRDLFSDYDTIRVNRGSNHGLEKGMAAVTVNGVVGYIIQLEATSAQILLITDRYAVVDAIVQRSRARGIIQGHRTHCSLDYLKRNDDVQIGDLIVTSGFDNVFPKGFPIGVVTAVDKDDYGLGQTVQIQPVVNATNLEEIFIVIDAKEHNSSTI